jgi:peptidoglycan/LPS O-acetylase OafA/YrhL
LPQKKNMTEPSQSVLKLPAEGHSKRGISRHIPALDGIRGIAILLVFFYHFNGSHKSANLVVRTWTGLADTGWVGVDLFFVLSGFLITGILFDTAHERAKVKNFYARRSLRIFPLYYGVLLVFLLLTPVLQLHWKPGHLLYFVYLSNMMPILTPGLQSPGPGMMAGHLWSLAVEEQFYLIWPFIVWHIGKRKKLLQVCLLIMLGTLILRVILVCCGVGFGYIFPLLPTRIDSLVCGGAAALLARGPAPSRLPVRPVLVVSGVLTLGVFLGMSFTSFATQILATVGYTVIAIFFAGLVFCAQQGRGLIARIGSLRSLRFFGRYSYGLYMYHGFLFPYLISFVHPIQRFLGSEILGGMIVVIVSLGMTLGIAMLSYNFFEAPILKLKKRFA